MTLDSYPLLGQQRRHHIADLQLTEANRAHHICYPPVQVHSFNDLTQVRALPLPLFMRLIERKQTHTYDERSPRQRLCGNI